MLTIHRTTVVGKCPHGCADVYDTEFHVAGSKVLTVERIQRAIFDMTTAPIYQEDLTRLLSQVLGCKVVTRGRHAAFETECVVDHPGTEPENKESE